MKNAAIVFMALGGVYTAACVTLAVMTFPKWHFVPAAIAGVLVLGYTFWVGIKALRA